MDIRPIATEDGQPAVSGRNIKGHMTVITGLILFTTVEGECLGTAMALDIIPSQAEKGIPAREAVVGMSHPLPVGALRIDKNMLISMTYRNAKTVAN